MRSARPAISGKYQLLIENRRRSGHAACPVKLGCLFQESQERALPEPMAEAGAIIPGQASRDLREGSRGSGTDLTRTRDSYREAGVVTATSTAAPRQDRTQAAGRPKHTPATPLGAPPQGGQPQLAHPERPARPHPRLETREAPGRERCCRLHLERVRARPRGGAELTRLPRCGFHAAAKATEPRSARTRARQLPCLVA